MVTTKNNLVLENSLFERGYDELTLVKMLIQNENCIPITGKFLKNLYHQHSNGGKGPE